MAQAILHHGSFLGKRDGLRVMACRDCGFAHLEMLPDAAALADYYAKDFWREKPGALERIEEQREWWAAIHGDWLELVEQCAPGRMLLDVGCGYGHFMRAADARAWNIEGIEPNLDAAKYAQTLTGHAPWRGTWDNEAPEYESHPYPFAGKSFDCVSALWLIEHLTDPLRFLRWCHARLVNSGVLLVVTPNDFNRNQEQANKMVARPTWWIDKTHISYFTSVTLANLLGRAGFRVVDHLTMFPMELFLMRGHDYTTDDEIGRRCHKRVERFDLRMKREERIALYRRWARAGTGREIVFVAAKDDD